MDCNSDIFCFESFNRKQAWDSLELVLTSVLTLGKQGKITCQDWFTAFRNVYMMHMCFDDPYGVDFYLKTREFLTVYVKHVYSRLVEKKGWEFSGLYLIEWKAFNSAVNYINRLFHSFNRNIAKRLRHSAIVCGSTSTCTAADILEINKLMYELWYKDVVSPLIDTIRNEFSSLFHKTITSQPDKPADKILRAFTHSVYVCNSNCEDKLEDDLLYLLHHHTAKLSQDLSAKHSDSDFNVILSEIYCCSKSLLRLNSIILPYEAAHSTRINNSLLLSLIADHIHQLTNCFLASFCDESSISDAKMVAELARMCETLKEKLASGFQTDVSAAFEELIGANLHRSDLLCTAFLKCSCNYEAVLSETFPRDKHFRRMLEEGIMNAVQKLETRDHLHLKIASYLDRLLFSAPKVIASELFKKQISVFLKIYTASLMKESFNKLFLYHICKRVLEQNSIKLISRRLEAVSGQLSSDFNLKLNRVFADHDTASATGLAYLKSAGVESKTGVSVMFYPVRAELWPFSVDSELILPASLRQEYAHFERFYKTKHPNRRLRYSHPESFGVVLFRACEQVYRLVMNTCQLTLFANFNEIDFLTLHELSERTKLPPALVNNIAGSFVRLGILTPKLEGFTINTEFSSQRKTLKLINTYAPQKTDTVKPKPEQTDNMALSEEREHTVARCLLVQLLKIHSELNINDLLAMLKQNCKHAIDFSKDTVELVLKSLIERDFVRTKPDTPDTYVYIP